MSDQRGPTCRQAGVAPIALIFLAAAGIIGYLLISNTVSFNNGLLSQLFPKPPSQAAPPSESVPDEILLKFKERVRDEVKDNIRKAHGIDKLEEISQIGVEVGKVPQKAKDKIIEALNKNPNIEYAEANHVVQAQLNSDDYYFPNQWALAKIETAQGWGISTGNVQSIIAVLDTGIDLDHEDLASKVFNPATAHDDVHGHGTVVSGVAGAATNNSIGVAGICWLCPVLSIRVLTDSGSGSDSAVASGMVAAADQGARVINLSLGGYSYSQTMQNAASYAWGRGVVVVAGSGNDGLTSPFYPAANENVVAVGATSSDDTKLSISNYGSWLDVVAPGLSILTTKRGGSYGFASGTSLASPHVAGLAGLIFSANPSLTNVQVVDIITSTSDDLGPLGRDDEYGWGRINVAKALQKATNTIAEPTPTPTPTPSPTPMPTSAPDTTAPAVSVISPQDGSSVSGSVNIQAQASDNVAVQSVSIFVDGGVVNSCTDTSCSYIWDTTSISNGSHTIQAKALDVSSNLGESAILSVTVFNTTNPSPSSTLIPTPSPTPMPEQAMLTGYVRDAQTNNPIAGAQVKATIPGLKGFLSKAATTISDSNGFYVLSLNENTYNIEANASGYSKETQTVTVSQNATVSLNFSLSISSGGGLTPGKGKNK